MAASKLDSFEVLNQTSPTNAFALNFNFQLRVSSVRIDWVLYASTFERSLFKNRMSNVDKKILLKDGDGLN